MKQKIYNYAPNVIQNLMVSIYNKLAYKTRYGGLYKQYREEKRKNRTLTYDQLKAYQAERYSKFIAFVVAHSPYYKETIGDIDNVADINYITQLPIVSKEDLRKHINRVVVRTDEKLQKSKTGGTTGKSLEVYNFARNSQERFAFLDDFRSRFGYELGKRTAWFSGKSLLTNRDIKKNRFWKSDVFHNVKYYSTFHIHQDYLKNYVENLMKYKPEYFVGFPSTMYDIAKYGIANGYDYPADTIKAVFPTAETITKQMRETIEKFFKTKLYDQYASSEGAPFIFECVNGNLHLEMQSGVFEVLDENNEPTQSGRLVVTSFTNEGTPLIRYDIGDSITLEDESKGCNCGNHNPLVKEILGRIDDYVYSPEVGKINLGNVSNTLKDTYGIIRFQAIQNDLNKIELLVETDKEVFNKNSEEKFISNWRERIGNKMELSIDYVDDIPVEASGKFRIVKNNVKGLVE